MFTGIITAVGQVREAVPIGPGPGSPVPGGPEPGGPSHDMRLVIAAPPAFLAGQGGTAIGASIACSGCCLTATSLGEDWFAVDVSAESLARTAIGTWSAGTPLNLERSLCIGDELGGHLVSGHVDAVGCIVSIEPEHGSLRFTVAVPPPLHRFIAEKGSVAIDGISLTVNGVGRDHAAQELFDVNVIPHTAAHTTLSHRRPGDPVHIEIDMLARYVARLSDTRLDAPSAASPA